DTAYYEPERRAVYHYKGPRWFLINTATPGKQPEDATDTVEGWHIGVHQWACGHKGVNSLQGTWKDAEDGLLSGNPIAQGSVDSTVAAHLTVPPQMTQTTYYWLAAGSTFEEVTRLNRSVRQRGPWHFINRTAAYWHLWLDTHRPDFADLPSDVSRIYLLSLLILRTQIDNGGAILAANDSDIASTVRDTYSYMWPRDGALTAHALDLAGYLDLTRPFYRFCREVLRKRASCCTSTTRTRRWPRAGIRGSATAAKSYRSKRTKPRWSSGPCGCIFRSGRISNTSSRSTARSSFAPPISWRPIAIRRPGCRS